MNTRRLSFCEALAHKTIILGAFFAALAIHPVEANAGDDGAEAGAEYVDEQRQLNESAVRAIIGGDYALAISLLEESNAIGELNITYLNLGRAYQKNENCEAARKVFDKVESAPKVARPSPQVVSSKLEQYRGELDAECEPASPAEDAPADGATTEQPAPSPETDNPSQKMQADTGHDVDTTARTSSTPNYTWAWVAGSGVALMGAGLGAVGWAGSLRGDIKQARTNDAGYVSSMSRAEALEQESKAETLDNVGLGLTIGGAIVTATGAYFLFTSDGETETSLSLQLGPNSAGANWTISY